MTDQLREPRLSIPVELRRGALRGDQWKSIESGRALVDNFLALAEWESLANKKVLDIGCGVKIAQAILEYDLPIGHYHGLDISTDLIDALNEGAGGDDRVEFTFSDIYNELYNPNGEQLTDTSQFPIAPASVDVAWAFSVFTHLNSEDTKHTLRMARECLVDGGLFLFSAFVDRSEGAAPFVDAIPSQPLKWAIFSEEHFIDLVLDSGLEIVRYREPDEHIQHQLLCRRVDSPSRLVPDIEETDFVRDGHAMAP